ncbi:MAG: ABC transporter permease [Prevotella sp.]
MCHIWAEEMKNVVRDEGVLIFFVLVPLLYPILYSWIYNNEVVREVPVAVVDNSHSSMSRMFIREFDASPDTRVAYHCNSLDEAKDLVGRQAVHGVIYFPQDFQTRINRMEQSHVSVYCDMSLMLTYKAIFQTASSVAANINSKIQTSLSGNTTGREDEITIKPLDFDEIPMFNTTGGYGNFILPGVLMLIIQQTLLLGIGLSAGTAREKNKYKELIPVSRHYNGIFRIVLGKSICYFMIYSVIAAYVTLVIPRMFGFVSLVHAPDLVTFMLPYLLSCIFFGMMLSCLVRYRENVILLVVFSSILFLFLSGMSWPSSNIPGTWKAVSWLFPSTFGIQGFVSMNTAGARLGDISLQYICLWIQTVVFFIMTCAVYKFQIDRVKKLRSREQ